MATGGKMQYLKCYKHNRQAFGKKKLQVEKKEPFLQSTKNLS